MTTYNVRVLNQSGFPKDYVLFSEPPAVTSSGAAVEVFTNAWVTFTGVGNGGFDSVTIDEITDAYWGTTPSALSPTVVVMQGGFAGVVTATRDSVIFSNASGAVGFGANQSGIANTGSFQIEAQSDFTAANNYVFGLAKPTGTPIPSPVATFAAEPNDTFEVIPVVKFYVADGNYVAGEIIDVQSFSTVPAAIDFTGLPSQTATVVQGTNGSFTVSYS